MKLVSYTLMACTLNEVLRTKISESPPLAPSLGTRTSLRSTSERKKERGLRVSLSRACSFFHPNTFKRLLRTLDTHTTIVAKANKLLGSLKWARATRNVKMS